VSSARFVPPVLIAATLILLGANALPTVRRKHLLQQRRQVLLERIREHAKTTARLRLEIDALQNDPFYMQRILVETWHALPAGAMPLDPPEATLD